ncbi:hypothetical protein, partial [Mesobacillus boroniphilus]|uniref:hypothetical protein n=1 Tax=Mesobacillus boroniphilus TaxID=308892 RepID=UPI001FB0D7E0
MVFIELTCCKHLQPLSPLICLNMVPLRTFAVTSSSVLSEPFATSAICGDFFLWFILTCHYFGHFKRLPPPFWPNLSLLRTFQ